MKSSKFDELAETGNGHPRSLNSRCSPNKAAEGMGTRDYGNKTAVFNALLLAAIKILKVDEIVKIQ